MLDMHVNEIMEIGRDTFFDQSFSTDVVKIWVSKQQKEKKKKDRLLLQSSEKGEPSTAKSRPLPLQSLKKQARRKTNPPEEKEMEQTTLPKKKRKSIALVPLVVTEQVAKPTSSKASPSEVAPKAKKKKIFPAKNPDIPSSQASPGCEVDPKAKKKKTTSASKPSIE